MRSLKTWGGDEKAVQRSDRSTGNFVWDLRALHMLVGREREAMKVLEGKGRLGTPRRAWIIPTRGQEGEWTECECRGSDLWGP